MIFNKDIYNHVLSKQTQKKQITKLHSFIPNDSYNYEKFNILQLMNKSRINPNNYKQSNTKEQDIKTIKDKENIKGIILDKNYISHDEEEPQESKEEPKEEPPESKEEPQEESKEEPQEESKEEPQEEPKEEPQEESKEEPQEESKEEPKESKEEPKEESKEEPKEESKEDLIKEWSAEGQEIKGEKDVKTITFSGGGFNFF